MTRLRLPAAVLAGLLAAGACVPKTPPDLAAASPELAYEQKLRLLLQLEDERVLQSSAGSLLPLMNDPEARVRRRAELAAGRVRLAGAVPALGAQLTTEQDPEVRQMAAFALGQIGDPSAVSALLPVLNDPDPIMQGRAAEALGALGDASAAAPIGAMVTGHVNAGALNGLVPDDMGYPKGPATEAVRLGLYALVRLKAYDQLAAAVVDGSGQPRSRWWPVAFALQRIANAKAEPALLALLQGEGQLTRAFAARGLGVLKAAQAVAPLTAAAADGAQPMAVRIQAVRALAAIGDPRAAETMVRIIMTPRVEPNLQLEAVTALGQLKQRQGIDLLIDLASTAWPSMRAAALTALARLDPDTFVAAISGLDPDAHWSVRAALAGAVAELPRERAEVPLRAMLRDADQRVIPSVLDAMVKVRATGVDAVLIERLQAEDPVVRAAAARGLAALKPAGAVQALTAAVATSQRDGLYVARAAALDALSKVDAAAARPLLVAALGDKDWAVRLKAAELLRPIDPAADLSAMRPAPPPVAPELAAVDTLVAPPFSPTAYIDTAKGTIQIELAIVDAPRTVANFMALVRKGYFAGVAWHRVVPDFVVQGGDPRGDGEGGPGYTIRDEINQRPYLRGTVGMALDWADTGGSQFFITHSPQPHLDGRYTVFGQVISGMDVVDRLSQWDVIERIRVWDGVAWIGT